MVHRSPMVDFAWHIRPQLSPPGIVHLHPSCWTNACTSHVCPGFEALKQMDFCNRTTGVFRFFLKTYILIFSSKKRPQFQSGFRDPFRQVHRREDATAAFHGCGKDEWPPDVEGYWYRYWCSNHAQLPGMGARVPWWIIVRNVGENVCKLLKT